MNLLTLIAELKRLHITLSIVDGDATMIYGKEHEGVVTPELIASVKRHKPALLDALMYHPSPSMRIQVEPRSYALPDWEDLPDWDSLPEVQEGK